MQFEVKNVTRSLNDVMRVIGYKPAFFQNDGEFSIVRQIGRNDYPRFHVYIKTDLGDLPAQAGKSILIFNLHLDQKKPSYEGAKGHSGDYDGDVIENEAERIQRSLVN